MYVYHLLFRSKNTDFSCLNNCNTLYDDIQNIQKPMKKGVINMLYIR